MMSLATVNLIAGCAPLAHAHSAQFSASDLENMTFGRYSSDIAAKSAIRIGLLKVTQAHNRARSGFFMRNALSHLSMVGWAGASSEAPVSWVAGRPTLFSSPPMIGLCGGEFKKTTREAAIMATVPAQVVSALCISSGNVITTSIDVAKVFQKQHHNVIQKIKTLECSAEFTDLNFKASEYTDSTGRKLPQYQITRDGFAFLAMGFTGTRAARFKEWFITAFNDMEKRLSEQKPARIQYVAPDKSEIERLARQLMAAEKAKEEAEQAKARYEMMLLEAAHNADRGHVYEFIAPNFMWPSKKRAAIIRLAGRTRELACRGWPEMVYLGERKV
ncbi:Rha family phage regulatory protein [Plesiomonas shigelloides]|uniref:Rha family phage regulatory protein n=1 Tax=Plesiomonas shigelloides TaxID=703 RepID=UPI00387F36A1